MIRTLFVALALLPSIALAEGQPTSATDRIAIQIGALLIRTETQQDMIASLQKELAAAQARLKELEPKRDEKP